MSDHSALLYVMRNAASVAARSLLRDFGEVEALQVSLKGAGDFVTRADLRAESVLKRELGRARPAFGFLMEESGATQGLDPDSRFVVDPLDGTLNFLHGVPHFAISIACQQRGQWVAGVVYDPMRDEMFYAARGEGAYLNQRRLRVKERQPLSDALVAIGIRGGRENAPGGPLPLRPLSLVLPRCAGVRRLGAAALDLAWVAAGRYDGFFEHGLKIWDMAAGALLVLEAGGLVSDYGGAGDPLVSGRILAAPAAVHDALNKLLKAAQDDPCSPP